MEMELKDIEINNSEVETIAFNIYKDIAEYIKQHIAEYMEWFLKKISKNYVQTIDGIEEITNYTYKYEICNYERNRI